MQAGFIEADDIKIVRGKSKTHLICLHTNSIDFVNSEKEPKAVRNKCFGQKIRDDGGCI